MRNASGDPAVIRNAPLLDDGTPMPTRYWLVDPDLSLAGGAARVGRRCARRRSRGRARRRSAPRTSGTRASATRRSRPITSGPRPSGGVGGTARGRQVPARAPRVSPRGRRRSGGALGRGEPAMTRVAAIDMGTNSTRLLVADVDGAGRDAKLVTVDRRTKITRLGKGVDRDRTLHPDAIERVLAALREYRTGHRRSRRRARARDGDERGARREQPRRTLRSGRAADRCPTRVARGRGRGAARVHRCDREPDAAEPVSRARRRRRFDRVHRRYRRARRPDSRSTSVACG